MRKAFKALSSSSLSEEDTEAQILKRTLKGERAIFLGTRLGLVDAPVSELSDPTGEREYGDSGRLPPLLDDASDLKRNRFFVGLIGEPFGRAAPVVTDVTFSLIDAPLPLLALSPPRSSARSKDEYAAAPSSLLSNRVTPLEDLSIRANLERSDAERLGMKRSL